MVAQLTDGTEPLLAVIAPQILGLDELAGEHRLDIYKIDAVLLDIGQPLRLVPFERHRRIIARDGPPQVNATWGNASLGNALRRNAG